MSLFLAFDIAKVTIPVSVGLILLFLVVIFAFGSKIPFTTKELAFAAVCLALSYALSFIKFFSMPQGGSVTPASALPLLIFAYFFGWKKGLIVGFVYSLLQIMQKPELYHPVQVLLDYPLAYTAIFVAGFFRPLGKPGFYIGITAYGILRYIFHVISGAVFFGAYAWEGWGAWPYSLVYNTTTLVEMAVTLLIGVLLFSSNSFVSQLEKFVANAKQPLYQKKDTEQ
ncbi:MAG TPA: energy-coupled thiamine transporter ThiT [Clostridia bacterium]